MSGIQRRTLTKFWGVPGVSLGIILVPMVLGPVSCPAEIQCTTVFALRSGKFSRLGGEPPPSITPLGGEQWCRSKSIAWVALLIARGALFLYVSI